MSFFRIAMAAALFLFILGLAITTSEAEPNYIFHFCSNTTAFNPNSTYKSNLNLLLSFLASNSTRNNNSFYNTTIGQTPYDTVYGLFLCRGDVSTDVCHDCVTFAAQDIVQRCPALKVTIIWYDECLLRYSNQSILNNVDNATITFYSRQNSTYQISYQDLVQAMLNDLASQASNNTKMFAIQAANFPGSYRTLYTLAQCTQDLSARNCQMCLRIAISMLENENIGGRIMSGSCIVRYETYLFYNESAAPGVRPPPLPPVSPSPSPLYLPPPPPYLAPPASHEGNF